ncbi:hypothetical protein L9F63_006432 [Diploptera punctata]|uniref:RNA-binding region-containing protein 3 n=1 Tax=Diploptera punctata TaxID=6984 RepID=A0AAD7ZAA3_DIPPU|nr:hypothetical protein L9F63_006432 [Diploptera punctata]
MLKNGETEKSAIAAHAWSEKHRIETKTKLLKQLEKPKELTIWEKIYICKNENTTMNFEIPGYKERGLIWKFFGRPPDGTEVSLQDRRPLDVSCGRDAALTMSQITFESEKAATIALAQLHQMPILGHRISVEYARGTSDKVLSPVQKHNIRHRKEEEEESKESCKKHFQAFQHKLNNWNSSLNITQPAPSHLKYQYPPPTQMVLHNICCALASVPKFYTQVLHLMNKMNLPCPFDSSPFPEPDIMATPQVSEQSQNVLIPEASSDQDEESELESDGEGHTLLGEIIPPKRSLPQKPKKVKRPKFIKPVPSSSVTVKPIKPEQVFEKVEPVHRKIELKFATVSEMDNIEKGSNKMMEASGTEELASNRISSRDQKHLPVFKNYQPGIPSCRLYIKNLSKQVTERDLHYIYRRYLISEEEMGGTMFNVQLMKEGRMKGQAFITLQNVKQAEAALKETNGYILKDKPLVVQFARSAKAK